MKALLKALGITAGIVIALAAVFVALVMQPTAPKTEGVVFVAVEPIDIASVTVRNETGEYSYFYENDGYVLDDIPGTIVDLDGFINFMTGCASLSAIQAVEGGTPEDYGLVPPVAAVDIHFFKGNTLRLEIGAQEKISGNYYVTASGFPGVYLMESAMAAPFLLPKSHMIIMRATQLLMVSSPFSAIRDIIFEGGLLEEPVTILATAGGNEEVKNAALSFGSATHLVKSAGWYQLDQNYGIEILGALFDIPALEVLYNLPEEKILALGFDSPWMTVSYDMINGQGVQAEHCLLRIIPAEDNTFYVTVNSTGVVYRIARQPFMDIQLEKLLLRWFCTPMLMDVSAVMVAGDGQTYRFDVDNADRKNPVITADGETLQTPLFRSLFRLLTSAAHDGAYLGRFDMPQGEPMLTITYEYGAEGKAPDVIELYPGDVRRANVFVNGQGEFAMKDQFALRVLEGCRNLLAGQPIEEKW